MHQISVVFHRSPRRPVELSLEDRVNPDRTAKCGTGTAGEENATALGSACLGNLNVPNRRMRTRMSGGVGGLQERPTLLLPIPIGVPAAQLDVEDVGKPSGGFHIS